MAQKLVARRNFNTLDKKNREINNPIFFYLIKRLIIKKDNYIYKIKPNIESYGKSKSQRIKRRLLSIR